MSAYTSHQVITQNGKPLFVLVPYNEYLDLIGEKDRDITIPHEVVELHVMEERSIIRAWREYKKMSQREVADRMGISQSAYSQMEKPDAPLRKATLKKIANALRIKVEQIQI